METKGSMAADIPGMMPGELLHPLGRPSRYFCTAAALLLLVIGAALGACLMQMREGIGVSGKGSPIMWGFYITHFLFWTGVGHGGILLSALFRLTHTGRLSILTRGCEIVGLCAIAVGAAFPILHLGRPECLYWMVPFPNQRHFQPNFSSPLVWDFFGINFFLLVSLAWVGLRARPDFGALRDRVRGWKRHLFSALAMGWHEGDLHGSRRGIQTAVIAMSVGAIAISTEAVVALIFLRTLNPGWNSPLMIPVFIVGAAFSAVAVLILVLSIARPALRLHPHLHPWHFDRLGGILLGLSVLWAFLTLSENWMLYSGAGRAGQTILFSRLTGRYAGLFWTTVLCCFVIPCLAVLLPKLKSIRSLAFAAASVIVGNWLDRFIFIVSTLAQPRLTFIRGVYEPTPVDWIVTAGAFAGFSFLCLVFSRVIPFISILEVENGP